MKDRAVPTNCPAMPVINKSHGHEPVRRPLTSLIQFSPLVVLVQTTPPAVVWTIVLPTAHACRPSITATPKEPTYVPVD